MRIMFCSDKMNYLYSLLINSNLKRFIQFKFIHILLFFLMITLFSHTKVNKCIEQMGSKVKLYFHWPRVCSGLEPDGHVLFLLFSSTSCFTFSQSLRPSFPLLFLSVISTFAFLFFLIPSFLPFTRPNVSIHLCRSSSISLRHARAHTVNANSILIHDTWPVLMMLLEWNPELRPLLQSFSLCPSFLSG